MNYSSDVRFGERLIAEPTAYSIILYGVLRRSRGIVLNAVTGVYCTLSTVLYTIHGQEAIRGSSGSQKHATASKGRRGCAPCFTL
jgi:hypothetical protein